MSLIATRRREYWLTYCLSGLLVSIGCSQPPPLPPTQETVLAAFKISENQSTTTTGHSSRPQLNLYVDGSESMKGFVSDWDSTYVRVLRRILEKAVTARYRLNTYRFSNEFASVSGLLRSQLVSTTFYNGTDTPLASLFNRLASDMLSRDSLSVVVSDFVQSEKGEDQLSLIRAFENVAKSHPEVLLMAFRSSFRGTYFVETFPKGKFQLDMRMRRPEDGRPFFLLVTAPSKDSLLQFQQYVLIGLGEDESFQPTSPPLVVQRVEFIPISQDSPPVWNRYGAPGSWSDGSDAAVSIWRFVERQVPGGSTGTLRLRMTLDPRIPLKYVEKLTYQIEQITFQMGKAEQQPIVIGLQPKVQGKPDGSIIVVTYPFERPRAHTWDVYRIRIRAGDGNLAVPMWVGEWTTEDDRSARNASRTLHLNLFIEAMVRGITENVVFSDQIIQLGRGD